LRGAHSRIIQQRSWGSFPSQVCSHQEGGRDVSTAPHPACRSRPFFCLDHFRRVDRRLIFLEGIDQQTIDRIGACVLPGINLLSDPRLANMARRVPALGFILLQGCGRDGSRAFPWSRHRSVGRGIVGPCARLLEHHPLMGLRRPSCADVPDTSGCIHLHGAVQRAPASPALQRISRPAPRRSLGEFPPDRLPV